MRVQRLLSTVNYYIGTKAEEKKRKCIEEIINISMPVEKGGKKNREKNCAE